MRKKNNTIKLAARELLMGRYGIFAASVAVTYLVQVIASLIPSLVFGNPEAIHIIALQLILSFLLSAFTNMFGIGTSRLAYCLCREKEYGFKDIVYAFSNESNQFLKIELLLTAIQTAISIPVIFLKPLTDSWGISAFGYSLLLIAANLLVLFISILLTLRLTLAVFVLMDNPTLSAGVALKESLRITKGKYGSFLYLKLSFIGMYILGILSILIGFLFVKPYAEVSTMLFYMKSRDKCTF